MPESTLSSIAQTLKDGVYAVVGLGVMGFQQAQVQTEELRKNIEDQMADARAQFERAQKALEEQYKTVEDRYNEFEERMDGLLDQFQENLPEPVRQLVQQSRDAAKSASD